MSKLESILGIKPAPSLEPLTREEAAVVRDALKPLVRLVMSKVTLADLVNTDLTFNERVELRYYTAALAISRVMKGLQNLTREVAASGKALLKAKLFNQEIPSPGVVPQIVFRVPDDAREHDRSEELIIEAMFNGLYDTLFEVSGVKYPPEKSDGKSDAKAEFDTFCRGCHSLGIAKKQQRVLNLEAEVERLKAELANNQA